MVQARRLEALLAVSSALFFFEHQLAERDQHPLGCFRQSRGHPRLQTIDKSGGAGIVLVARQARGQGGEDRSARESSPASSECVGVAVTLKLRPDFIFAGEDLYLVNREIRERSPIGERCYEIRPAS